MRDDRTGGDSPEQLLSRLRTLEELGRRKEVIELAEQAVRQFPDSVGLRLALAEALQDHQNAASAEHFRRAVLEARSDDGWALVRAATGMHHLEHADEAFDWCEQAGALIGRGHTAYPFLINLQGRLSAWIGEVDNAELYFRHAVAMAPDVATFWTDLAEFLSFRGRASEAEGALENALQNGVSADYIQSIREVLRARADGDRPASPKPNGGRE